MANITVYITSHNYGQFLPEAIDSVIKQTFTDWQLILINDGSDNFDF
jgi:glycosyltransferase involved in cell wall biosynthesis